MSCIVTRKSRFSRALIARDDLVVEVAKAWLALGNEHRMEGPFSVARNLDVENVVMSRDALAAGAVAVVVLPTGLVRPSRSRDSASARRPASARGPLLFYPLG